MKRILPGTNTLALLALLVAQSVFAQSSPLSNCKFYAKSQGDYEQGLPHCEAAIAENPEDPEMRFYGAVCQAEMGTLDKAWENFEWLIERKDHPEKGVRKYADKADKQALFYYKNFFNRGVELLDAGERASTEEALVEFEKATTIYPLKIDAYLNLGYAQILLADLEGALHSFERAVEMDPEHETAHVYYWDALSQQLSRLRKEKAPPAAIAELSAKLETVLKKVLEHDPSQAEAYLGLMDLAMSRGESEKAIEYVSKAIEIAPESVYTLFNMGVEFYQNDDYEGAIRCFQIVLDRMESDDPNRLQAQTVLAWSYYYADQFEPAVPILEKLIEVEPGEKDHYGKLGMALSKLDRKDEAGPYLVKYQEMQDAEIMGEQ